MALIVGNLLEDPAATSFISLEAADVLLGAEANAAWAAALPAAKEAALTNASRWMAVTLPWCADSLTEAQLVLVGHVAARLAVPALSVDLWASEAIGKQAKRYKAGSVEIEYADAERPSGAVANGKRFPWVYPMLRGLLCDASQRKVVRA